MTETRGGQRVRRTESVMNPPIARQLNLDETKLAGRIFERLSRRGAT